MGVMMKDLQRVGPMRNLERRHRGSGQVSEVECRSCGAPIALNPRAMQPTPSGKPAQVCPACGAARELRLYDWERVAPPRDETRGEAPARNAVSRRRRAI